MNTDITLPQNEKVDHERNHRAQNDEFLQGVEPGLVEAHVLQLRMLGNAAHHVGVAVEARARLARHALAELDRLLIIIIINVVTFS